ncbi:MAG: peptidoglycan-binding domain-containing protein [Pyrinomonadaceae bacterium]
MKRLLCLSLTLLFALSTTLAAQSSVSGNTAPKPAVKRGPVFRATKDQIKQAQALLKNGGHYAGEQTGKLDDATRAALRKYQQAEGLKATGTLNRDTLSKMSITLTDRQKAM